MSVKAGNAVVIVVVAGHVTCIEGFNITINTIIWFSPQRCCGSVIAPLLESVLLEGCTAVAMMITVYVDARSNWDEHFLDLSTNKKR